MTPKLALGGEAFWLGQQRKSGTGFAARYSGDKCVATGQVATTGLVSLTYVQRISEKVRLVDDREIQASTVRSVPGKMPWATGSPVP